MKLLLDCCCHDTSLYNFIREMSFSAAAVTDFICGTIATLGLVFWTGLALSPIPPTPIFIPQQWGSREKGGVVQIVTW